MASDDERLQFSRKSTMPSRLPILTTPRLPESLKRDPRIKEAMDAYDREWDEWRKRLIPIVSQTILSVVQQAVAGGSTPAGPQGVQTVIKETIVVQQAFEPPPYIPPSRDDTGTRTEIWIAKRMDGKPGIGSESDPYDGSTTAKLDALLASFDPNTTIHLGPGEFTTRGGYDGGGANIAWQPKAGWRLLGAGMYVTTLRLVQATAENTRFAIVYATAYCDGLQVAEITLDCDFTGQPDAETAERCLQAIQVNGSSLHYYRVRCIGYGTSDAAEECFAISNRQLPTNVQMRHFTAIGCVVELPHTDNAAPVTGIAVLGEQEEEEEEDDRWQVTSSVKACRFDLSTDGAPIPGTSIAVRVQGTILGLIENNVIINTGFGVYWDEWAQRDVMIRHNRFYGVVRACYLKSGAEFPEGTLSTWARVCFIGNEVDLRSNGDLAPAAIRTESLTLEADHAFAEIFVERNLIRMAIPIDDPNANAEPIYIVAADNVTLRENAIHRTVNVDDPIRVHNCTNVHVFDNRWNDLVLIQAYDEFTSPPYHHPELETLLDEATTLGLIGW